MRFGRVRVDRCASLLSSASTLTGSLWALGMDTSAGRMATLGCCGGRSCSRGVAFALRMASTPIWGGSALARPIVGILGLMVDLIPSFNPKICSTFGAFRMFQRGSLLAEGHTQRHEETTSKRTSKQQTDKQTNTQASKQLTNYSQTNNNQTNAWETNY